MFAGMTGNGEPPTNTYCSLEYACLLAHLTSSEATTTMGTER